MCPRLRSDTAQDPINKRRGGQMGVRAVEYSAVATREVVKTISEKCQVLGKMLEASRVKLHSAEEIAQDSIFAQTPLLQEMNRVFEQLQGTCVDPHMVGGERGKTLFDFVDAETVQSLQQDALEQTKEVEELLAAHQHAIRRIAAIYRFFVTFDKAHGSNVDALVGEHRELASIADEDAKPIGELYNAAVSFFVDMEQCDRFLLEYFTTINDIYPHYEGIFADVQLLFDELRSLRDFYRQFLASYQSVGAEILRRRQHDTKFRQFIEETKAKLAQLEQEEIALRRTFCEEHARFLPSTLCPEIQNLPDRYTVVSTAYTSESAARD
ncbi:Autophagy protein Apg17 [Phytophthora infestans]|uniref:Autophagy protein Apg17 n=2 Tax=Phytophthora infestans TaxID=4787 RepID=A0A8S9UVY4_PHYIN|nr:Autophagy protein Apg17 [Phytophthora infestans]